MDSRTSIALVGVGFFVGFIIGYHSWFRDVEPVDHWDFRPAVSNGRPVMWKIHRETGTTFYSHGGGPYIRVEDEGLYLEPWEKGYLDGLNQDVYTSNAVKIMLFDESSKMIR